MRLLSDIPIQGPQSFPSEIKYSEQSIYQKNGWFRFNSDTRAMQVTSGTLTNTETPAVGDGTDARTNRMPATALSSTAVAKFIVLGWGDRLTQA